MLGVCMWCDKFVVVGCRHAHFVMIICRPEQSRSGSQGSLFSNDHQNKIMSYVPEKNDPCIIYIPITLLISTITRHLSIVQSTSDTRY